jgi:predicted alpha-1,6-mannanase (GH76 family)
MKTAVDWLVDHLYLVIPNEERNFLEGLRKEALEKEKEQIIDAYYGNIDGVFGYREAGEEYYNQNYNQNK